MCFAIQTHAFVRIVQLIDTRLGSYNYCMLYALVNGGV
jgi:hypothetical protein